MRRTILGLGLVLLSVPRTADACGGCFGVPSADPQVVTDHRMVLSLSAERTTLWDQIRYSGSPDDFVWVLPVADAGDVEVGVGNNNFVDALDSLSSPILVGIVPTCGSTTTRTQFLPGSGGFGGSSFGCGGGSPGLNDGSGGRSIDYTETTDGGMTMATENTALGRMGAAVVGPYAITRVSTQVGAELNVWLTEHGYGVPSDTMEAIRYYAARSFDFIVVRLRPGAGVHQMEPIRVSWAGYRPTLPLRMIAAGAGDAVGLTLMVISSGRVQAQNFANDVIDASWLQFDAVTRRTNYGSIYDQRIRNAAVATWVTETVQNVFESIMPYDPRDNPDGGDSGVDDATVPDPTGMDSGSPRPPMDPIVSDAGGMDASPPEMRPSDPYVDRRIAFTGLRGRGLLTRMRTVLRARELSGDLMLEASRFDLLRPQQITVTNVVNPPNCPQPTTPPSSGGSTSTWDSGTSPTSRYTPPSYTCRACAVGASTANRYVAPLSIAGVVAALWIRRRQRRRGRRAQEAPRARDA